MKKYISALIRALSPITPHIIFLLMASVLVYSNTVGYEFAHDDTLEIVKNPYVKDLKYIPRAFTTSSWAWQERDPDAKNVSNYYRPTQTLAYIILSVAGHLDPKPFHIYKLMAHTLCVLLLFFVCLELFEQSAVKSFLAGLFFALHPMHTEAVTWISGITDVHCTIFVLASFYCFLRYLRHGRKLCFWLSGIFFFLGLLSKETAITAIPLFILYEYVHRKSHISIRNALKYGYFAVLALIYLILRMNAIGSFAPETKFAYLSGYEVLLNAFVLMAGYFWKLILPLSFNAHYEFNPVKSALNPLFLASFGAICGLLTIIWRRRAKDPILILGVGWIFLTLLPVMHCQKLGLNVFAERYLYLPSAGFCLILADVLFRLDKKPALRPIFHVLCVILLVFYSFQTIRRNRIWKDNISLYSDTVTKAPNAILIRNNLGNALSERGKIREAAGHYRKAIDIDPQFAEAHYNLANALTKMGRINEALAHFSAAVRLDPESAEMHNNLGVILFSAGRLEEAARHYREAIRLDSDYAQSYGNLGIIALRLGKFDEAIEDFHRVLEADPADAKAYYNIAQAYSVQEEYGQAIANYARAIRLDPEYLEAYYNSAVIHYSLGHKPQALEAFLKAYDIAVKKLGQGHPFSGEVKKQIESLGHTP